MVTADAVASLDVDLTAEETARLEEPYTPRYDFQGISDPAVLAGRPSHPTVASLVRYVCCEPANGTLLDLAQSRGIRKLSA